MKRFLIRFLTAPFMGAGIVWQWIAGSFETGRLLAVLWIKKEAEKIQSEREASAASERRDLH